MAATTYATQLRTAQVTDLVAEYVVDMAITDRGELPDKGAFLFEIIDDDDPKDDELARVCTVADMETFSLNRAEALLNEVTFYRSSTVTKIYLAIRDAVTAKDFLQDEVNKLVEEYITFLTEFQADPAEIIPFPQTALGNITPLLNQYEDTRELRQAQQEIVTEKTAECATLDAEYGSAVQAEIDAQATLDALNQADASLSASVTALNAIKLAGDDLGVDVAAALTVWNANRAAMSPPTEVGLLDDELKAPPTAGRLWTEYYDVYTLAQTQLDQDIAAATAASQALVAPIADAGTRLGNATAAKNAALSAKETCVRELAESEQVLDTLERQEQELLNDIRDLCPTFTPS